MMSTMICGRFETFSPPNRSIATAVSRLTRSEDAWADAGPATAQRTNPKTQARPPLRMRAFENDLAFIGDDPGQDGGERAHRFRVKACAGKVPQFLQRGGWMPRAPVRPRGRHRVVRIGHVDDVRGDGDLVAAQAM